MSTREVKRYLIRYEKHTETSEKMWTTCSPHVSNYLGDRQTIYRDGCVSLCVSFCYFTHSVCKATHPKQISRLQTFILHACRLGNLCSRYSKDKGKICFVSHYYSKQLNMVRSDSLILRSAPSNMIYWVLRMGGRGHRASEGENFLSSKFDCRYLGERTKRTMWGEVVNTVRAPMGVVARS